MQSSERKTCRILGFALAACAVLSAPASSQAGLIINLEPSDPPGTAPDMAGGGNLTDIINAAAPFWMAAFPDVNWTVDIQYRWGVLGSALYAQFSEPVLSDGHIISGVITFNNTKDDFYADPDPDPLGVPGYGVPESTTLDYEGNLLNVGRAWVAPAGSPAYGKLDLFMVATHEIGHALGLEQSVVQGHELIISPEISPKFAGYKVDLSAQDHIGGTVTALMASGLFWADGVRKGISAVDILTIAEINGWENPNLNPYTVPEPSSMVLLLMGVVSFGVAHAGKRRMARRRS